MDESVAGSDTWFSVPSPAPLPDLPHGERRRCPRSNFYYPTTFVAVGEEGGDRRGIGITVNVSSGGIFFICGNAGLRPGMRIGGSIRVHSSQADRGTVIFSAMVLRVGAFLVNGFAAHAMIGVAAQFDHPLEVLGGVPEQGAQGAAEPRGRNALKWG